MSRVQGLLAECQASCKAHFTSVLRMRNTKLLEQVLRRRRQKRLF
jgi:hypothetical protein